MDGAAARRDADARTVAGRMARLLAADRGGAWLTLLFGDRPTLSLSYRDFVERAQGVAGVLARFGVGSGDRMVVILNHGPELYTAYTGAMLAGAVPAFYAPPSPKLPAERFMRTIGALIELAGPRAIVTTPEIAVLLEPVLGGDVAIVPAATIASALAVPFAPARVSGSDAPAFLQFSSGTTGLRKGIAISHAALLWQVDRYAAAIGLGPEDRVASWLPLYHDMGLLTAFLIPLLTGCPVVAMCPFEWVRQPFVLLQAIDACRCSLLWLPNFAYHVLARITRDDLVVQLDLSCVRAIVNCSEPVTEAAHEALHRRLGPAGLRRDAFCASYAMAEATFAVTSGGFRTPLRVERVDRDALVTRGIATPAADTIPGAATRTVVSSGVPLAGTEIRILDGTGAALPERCVGEIAVRSPCLFTGYIGKDGERPAARFVEGFFRTGDQGYMADGQIHVLGRVNDMIIVRGKNLYPEDIEAAAGAVSGVVPGRCVAFGVFDEAAGTERLVVLAESRDVATADLTRRVYAAVVETLDLAPDEIHVVEPGWLLKSTSGKLARAANRDRFLATPRPRPPAPTTVEGRGDGAVERGFLARVRACVHEVVRQRDCFASEAIDDDEHLILSGLLDSFQLSVLAVALEEAFGIHIPAAALADPENVSSIRAIADLCRFLPPATRGESDSGRLADIQASIARHLVAKLNTRRYELLPQMRDYDRVGIIHNERTGRRVEANVRFDHVSTDEFGFRTAVWDGQPRRFADFAGHTGGRALLCGNSTPFGIGAWSDRTTVHNVLNDRTADRGLRWYNFSVRATLFPDERAVILDMAPRELDALVFVTGLNDASYLAAEAIREAGRPDAFPHEEYFRRHRIRMDGIRRQLAELAECFGPHRPRILYALQPNAFWIDKPYAPQEKEILSIYAAETDLLARVLRSSYFRTVQTAHSAALAQVCASVGIDYIDLNMLPCFRTPEWLFADAAHLTDQGQSALGAAILDWLDGGPEGADAPP